MKSIKISDLTHKNLMQIKRSIKAKNMTEVIELLIQRRK